MDKRTVYRLKLGLWSTLLVLHTARAAGELMKGGLPWIDLLIALCSAIVLTLTVKDRPKVDR